MPGIPLPSKVRDLVEDFDKYNAPRLLQRRRNFLNFESPVFDNGEISDPVAKEARPKPLNLTFRGATVLVAHLAANPPEHEVVARRLRFKGEALMESLRLDRLNDEIRRIETSRLGLLNGLLSERTVYRIGLRAGPELVKLRGKLYDPGQPFMKIEDNEDHLFDYTVRVRDEMAWEGFRYRARREECRQSGLFNPRMLDKIDSVWETRRQPGPRGSVLPGGEQFATDDRAWLEDTIELMDVFFYGGDGPTTQVTLPADPTLIGDDYLRIDDWQGPERGPMYWETFYPVPGKLAAVSWATMTAVQTLIANKLMNKIVDEALAARRLILASMGVSDKEIQAIEDSPDRSVLRVKDAKQFANVDLGGVIADLPKVLGPVMQWWNIQSGNVDLLGGTSEDAGTATEFQGLAANAGVIMAHLQQIHHESEEERTKALAQYLRTDPMIQSVLPYRIPGGEYVQLVYNPMQLEGDFGDNEYKIRPGSMGATDPNVLIRRLVEFMQVFAPMPGVLNPQACARRFGEVSGIDNLSEITNDLQGEMLMEQALAGAPPPEADMGTIAGPYPMNRLGSGMGRMPMGTSNGLTSGLGVGLSARSTRVPA